MSETQAILDRRHQSTLEWFALSNVLLAFDYDGTLAPLAETPKAARMREWTRRLLARVARLYPCVVISGRSLADLERRLEGIPLWSLVGNHGLEHAESGDGSVVRTGWAEAVRRRLPAVAGLFVEDKGPSITIHYRHVENKAAIRRAIHEAIRDLPEARALAGIEAVSLVPREGAHKGTALQETRRRFACDTAVYVGDDDTDEDAFCSGDPAQLLSVRVGPSRRTAAHFHVQDQLAVDALLRALVVARDGRRRPASSTTIAP